MLNLIALFACILAGAIAIPAELNAAKHLMSAAGNTADVAPSAGDKAEDVGADTSSLVSDDDDQGKTVAAQADVTGQGTPTTSGFIVNSFVNCARLVRIRSAQP